MSLRARRFAAAYARAEYWVLLDPPLRLQIGVHDAAAEAQLTAAAGRWKCWALLTACNPRSQRQSRRDNRRHHQALHRLVHRLRIRHIRSVNRDPAGRWPDEHGLLLLNVRPCQALGLARRFRQNALLAARIGQPPRLLWA